MISECMRCKVANFVRKWRTILPPPNQGQTHDWDALSETSKSSRRNRRIQRMSKSFTNSSKSTNSQIRRIRRISKMFSLSWISKYFLIFSLLSTADLTNENIKSPPNLIRWNFDMLEDIRDIVVETRRSIKWIGDVEVEFITERKSQPRVTFRS